MEPLGIHHVFQIQYCIDMESQRQFFYAYLKSEKLLTIVLARQ